MARTESAIGTPFYIPESLINGIKAVTLDISGQIEKVSAEPLHRPKVVPFTEHIVKKDFSLKIDLDMNGLSAGSRELGLSLSGIQVIALIRVPILSRYEILLKEEILNCKDGSFSIISSDYQSELFALGQSNKVEISVYLVIKEISKTKTFFPPLPGTFISGFGFRIQPPSSSYEFQPEELTPEKANELGIPKDCFVYVDFLDNASFPLLDNTEVKEALTIYVNQNIFQILFESTDQKSREMLVGTILSAATAQIIHWLSYELKDNPGIEYQVLADKKTVASIVLDKIKPRNMDGQKMIDIVRDLPDKAIAYADAELGTSKTFEGIL